MTVVRVRDRLWAVTISIPIVVEARDAHDARDAAVTFGKEHWCGHDEKPLIAAHLDREVRVVRDIPRGWRRIAPYVSDTVYRLYSIKNEEDDRTVLQILEDRRG